MRGTDRRASVRGQAARHVPVAKHPPSSHDWKAEEEDLFGLRRMAHAVERVGQIFDGDLYLLLGDPLGQEIDRHLYIRKVNDLENSAHDPSRERLPPAQLMAHLHCGALATRDESVRERICGHDHGIDEWHSHSTTNLVKVFRLHATLRGRVHLGAH